MFLISINASVRELLFVDDACCSKTAEGCIGVRGFRLVPTIYIICNFVGIFPKLWGLGQVLVVGVPQMLQKGDPVQ